MSGKMEQELHFIENQSITSKKAKIKYIAQQLRNNSQLSLFLFKIIRTTQLGIVLGRSFIQNIDVTFEKQTSQQYITFTEANCSLIWKNNKGLSTNADSIGVTEDQFQSIFIFFVTFIFAISLCLTFISCQKPNYINYEEDEDDSSKESEEEEGSVGLKNESGNGKVELDIQIYMQGSKESMIESFQGSGSQKVTISPKVSQNLKFSKNKRISFTEMHQNKKFSNEEFIIQERSRQEKEKHAVKKPKNEDLVTSKEQLTKKLNIIDKIIKSKKKKEKEKKERKEKKKYKKERKKIKRQMTEMAYEKPIKIKKGGQQLSLALQKSKSIGFNLQKSKSAVFNLKNTDQTDILVIGKQKDTAITNPGNEDQIRIPVNINQDQMENQPEVILEGAQQVQELHQFTKQKGQNILKNTTETVKGNKKVESGEENLQVIASPKGEQYIVQTIPTEENQQNQQIVKEAYQSVKSKGLDENIETIALQGRKQTTENKKLAQSSFSRFNFQNASKISEEDSESNESEENIKRHFNQDHSISSIKIKPQNTILSFEALQRNIIDQKELKSSEQENTINNEDSSDIQYDEISDLTFEKVERSNQRTSQIEEFEEKLQLSFEKKPVKFDVKVNLKNDKLNKMNLSFEDQRVKFDVKVKIENKKEGQQKALPNLQLEQFNRQGKQRPYLNYYDQSIQQSGLTSNFNSNNQLLQQTDQIFATPEYGILKQTQKELPEILKLNSIDSKVQSFEKNPIEDINQSSLEFSDKEIPLHVIRGFETNLTAGYFVDNKQNIRQIADISIKNEKTNDKIQKIIEEEEKQTVQVETQRQIAHQKPSTNQQQSQEQPFLRKNIKIKKRSPRKTKYKQAIKKNTVQNNFVSSEANEQSETNTYLTPLTTQRNESEQNNRVLTSSLNTQRDHVMETNSNERLIQTDRDHPSSLTSNKKRCTLKIKKNKKFKRFLGKVLKKMKKKRKKSKRKRKKKKSK